jgi:hypothetical protein
LACISIGNPYSSISNGKPSAMKCRFFAAILVVNPAWSQKAANDAADAGVPYTVPQQVEFGPGYVAEDPQAWIHCCPGDGNTPPIAEPADEECIKAVRDWMEVKRPAGIAQIKAQLEQIDLLTNKADKDRLLELGRAYGLIGSGSGGRSQTVPQPAVSPKSTTPAADTK